MSPGSLLTHAPLDMDLIPSKAYYDIIKTVASSLDFVMVQYYNGITRPAQLGINGTMAGETVSMYSHYSKLVNDIFSGDPYKVISGFCISDCSDSNATGE